MRRNLLALAIGAYFGIVLLKSEAAYWTRIQEMFRFGSIHMFGIMGIAVAIGAASVCLVKQSGAHALGGEAIDLTPKPAQYRAQLLGGIVFGLGWALSGACPGPIYVLIGAGFLPMIVVLISAIAGTYAYGLVREKLPH